jgi:hypothetical protein
MTPHRAALIGPKRWIHRGRSQRLVFSADIVAVDSPAITATEIAAGIQFSTFLAVAIFELAFLLIFQMIKANDGIHFGFETNAKLRLRHSLMEPR